MPDHLTFADVPVITLDGDDLPTIRMVVAKLGDYKDARYGTFGITEKHLQSWQRNLTACFDGRAAIDFDHSPEKGNGTKAAGWITSLERKTGVELQAEDPDRFAKLDPKAVYAASTVELSRAGAESVRNREYRYISPTFSENWTDETGAKRGPTLIGAGMTNRPFLRRGMPAISLSEDAYQAPAQAVTVESDSRGRMPDLTNIAKRLGLAEDADEAKILEALPGDDGKVMILTSDAYASLIQRAAQGDAATTTLAETRFKNAWEKALSEVRVTPASETDFKALAEKDLDLAVKMLDGLPKVAVNTEPRGHGQERTLTEAPDGVDPDRYELDNRVRAKMGELKTPDYMVALDAVLLEEGAAA